MFKKIVLFSLFMLLVTGQCFAKNEVVSVLLEDSSGTPISSYSLTSGNAVYSETIDLKNSAGYGALIITEDSGGGLGDVDISTEYSRDGVNFSRMYLSDMNGTITAEGLVALAFGNLSNINIRFSVHPIRYLRFKFDPDANSQITVYHSYIYDR